MLRCSDAASILASIAVFLVLAAAVAELLTLLASLI
jgi:hypothetical protein